MSCVLTKHELTMVLTASIRSKEAQASVRALKKAERGLGTPSSSCAFDSRVRLFPATGVHQNNTQRTKEQINLEIPSHPQSEDIVMSCPRFAHCWVYILDYTVSVCSSRLTLSSLRVKVSTFTC